MNLIETEKSSLYYDNYNDFNLLNDCINDISSSLLEYPKTIIYNKPATFHRCIGFFSDESMGYNYTRQIQKALPLSNNLKLLLKNINDKYSTQYNAILINKYNTGSDYIGKHSDDEKFIDNSGVFAISYGATRTFRVRNKITNKKVLDVKINSGDVLIMKGDFQKEFTHEIPIEKKIKECRYSFTFRRHLI